MYSGAAAARGTVGRAAPPALAWLVIAFSGSLLPFSQLGGGRQGEHVTGTWCCARVLGCCVK
jgi:hypothetical protein